MTDSDKLNKVHVFKKHLDQKDPKEDIIEVKIESIDESVETLISRAKDMIKHVS